MKERRRGRFFLSHELFEDFPDSVRLLWSGLVPLRVEHHYDRDGWECVADGEIFEPVQEGFLIPLYEISVQLVKGDENKTIGALLDLVPEKKAAA